MTFDTYIEEFLNLAFKEDIGDGDHTSLSIIPSDSYGKAHLLVKQDGILSGSSIAEKVFKKLDPHIEIENVISDGSTIKKDDIVFIVHGKIVGLLQAERLVLNIMQRMSGIATQTRLYVDKLKGLHTKILDTRKTTPGMRLLDKKAVKDGGGENHRIGLYDMILIKDNHIDFAGGIENAIFNAQKYLKVKNKNLKIEVESRSLNDVNTILKLSGVDRIMLDNFSIEETRKAVQIINGRIETESSGGITIENIRDYAECGVDYISVGALTHQIKSLDLSLKAIDF
jgi:nicotinate-nucleotide pyrophosphorylase (carboxylating)